MSRIYDIKQRGIYTDLLRELETAGNNVYVATPLERKFRQDTFLVKSGRIQILHVRTYNLQQTNPIKKGIGILMLERSFLKAIGKYWGDVKFDLILYSTPPITFNKIITKLKSRDNARSYLLLKDIFPQNAVDLGMFSRRSLIYKMFRKKEKTLYAMSDKIGCMSPANAEYILTHNPEVSRGKIEVFPNSLVPTAERGFTEKEQTEILGKSGIPQNKVISLFGGNLGKPQGIDFLIEVLASNEKRHNHIIIIVGNGTEFPRLQKWFDENQPKNAVLEASLPKDEYDQLVKATDIGLIFLDHRFTIPNYPSRFLSYLENAKPVMIASDPNTDIGKTAEKEGCGLWCESDSIEQFNKKIEKLIEDKTLRQTMGRNGREYFERELDLRKYIPLLFS